MASNPIKQLKDLLLWARKERIQLSQVQLGSLSVVIERDFGLQMPASAPDAPERRQSILEQYAGALAPALRGETAVEEQVNEPTEEDE